MTSRRSWRASGPPAIAALILIATIGCSTTAPTDSPAAGASVSGSPSPPAPPAPPAAPAPPAPPHDAPAVVSAPAGTSISSGQTALLTVVASGTDPLSYQWFAGSTGNTLSPMTGAVSASFTTPALTATTSYWVRVSNPYGTADSAAATVTVTVSSAFAAFEDQVLVLVNAQRAAGANCGGTAYPPAAALAMNENLRTAARGHSNDMATQNFFSHVSLDGRTFVQRIHDAGYNLSGTLGENIAAGYSTPDAVVTGWMSSTGHCQNIMSASYKSIGVGYAFGAASTYGHYWTQDFGGG